jgi:hypothetical protein
MVVHRVLEMAYTDIQESKNRQVPDRIAIKKYLDKIERTWVDENPTADDRSANDFELCLLFSEAVMPIYFDFWEKDLKLDWVSLESEFNLPWKLRDKTEVVLRGKRDGVFKRSGQKGLWLMEHKTKSRINEGSLIDQIGFEQQVMIYLTSLAMESKDKISGVLYNIIRRPQLRQKQGEQISAFAKRCAEDVDTRRDFYFLRLEVSTDPKELFKFRMQLGDILWDFVQWWRGKTAHYRNTGACESKSGTCDFLPICANNNYTRFFKRPKVFSELEG